MINSEYLCNLNAAQKEAVIHLDGPLLIVAGAGSGKTKVLTLFYTYTSTKQWVCHSFV